MKKIIAILVVWALFLYGLGAVAINIDDMSHIELINSKKSLVSSYDELDQYQDNMTENTGVLIGQIPIPENPINIQVAQSFIPTKDIITRAELFIGKNSTATYPLIVSIRSELIEDDLTSAIIEPDQVPTEEFDWVEIDFDDIFLTAGQTYYIVALTENSTDNFYGWGANNDSESYPQGCAWFSINDGLNWTNESASSNSHSVESFVYQHDHPVFDGNITWDMCFKTYGFDNQPPSIPTITGPTSGKPGKSLAFTLYSVDPDGDDIRYIINWGDNNTETTSFAPSGTNVTISHTWAEVGEYTIIVKAEDGYGAESDWSDPYLIIIKKSKSINNTLLRFLQGYPNILTIIRQLLNL